MRLASIKGDTMKMIRRSNVLSGRFDSETVSTMPAEVATKKDSFRITVKDDNGQEVYKNDEEPYEYHEVPALSVALQYFGAKMTPDQIQFLEEALKGDDTGPAVKKLVEVINADLKDSAKNNAYQRVFNAKKPLTEENIENANASIVRNFMKTQNVSDETAITTLLQYGVIPKEFTLEVYKGNKGKR